LTNFPGSVRYPSLGDCTKRTTEYVKAFCESFDQKKTRLNSITARLMGKLLPDPICFVVELQCFS
jgi:hypothetical protein